MEFSWKPARQAERDFIMKEEYQVYKKDVSGICLISGIILILLYIFVHMSAAASYKQIRYEAKQRNNLYGAPGRADVDLVLGADRVIDSESSMEPMNVPLDRKSAQRYYFFSYLFFLTLCAGVSSWFIYGHYKDYDVLRKTDIDVCYGRCAGKEYVNIRYNFSNRSHYSISLYLSDGTLLEDIPVSEPVCRHVKPGDLLLLANISGPCRGPDKCDDIDGIYVLEKQQYTEL